MKKERHRAFLRFSAVCNLLGGRQAAARVLFANSAPKSGYLFRGFAVSINIAQAALQSSWFGPVNSFKYHDLVKRNTLI
jgi:hypothetical protein